MSVIFLLLCGLLAAADANSASCQGSGCKPAEGAALLQSGKRRDAAMAVVAESEAKSPKDLHAKTEQHLNSLTAIASGTEKSKKIRTGEICVHGHCVDEDVARNFVNIIGQTDVSGLKEAIQRAFDAVQGELWKLPTPQSFVKRLARLIWSEVPWSTVYEGVDVLSSIKSRMDGMSLLQSGTNATAMPHYVDSVIIGAAVSAAVGIMGTASGFFQYNFATGGARVCGNVGWLLQTDAEIGLNGLVGMTAWSQTVGDGYGIGADVDLPGPGCGVGVSAGITNAGAFAGWEFALGCGLSVSPGSLSAVLDTAACYPKYGWSR